MDPTQIVTLITGPGGVVVVLLAALYFVLSGKYIAPQKVVEAAERRIEDLDHENSELNKTVIQLTTENATFRAELKALREQLSSVKEEINRLRKEVDGR